MTREQSEEDNKVQSEEENKVQSEEENRAQSEEENRAQNKKERANEKGAGAPASKAEKRQLRMEIKDRINALTDDYCIEADRKIAERLFGLDAWKRANVVFCYVGTRREIDTAAIIARALAEGKRVGVPLCTGPGIMEVRQIEDIKSLVPGSYGILEPGKECTLIRPGEIELAVIPGLAFTREGSRLGYGGGYYDRYLPEVKGLKVALCREKCLYSHLPTELHDTSMDGVLTEKSTFLLIHSVKV